MSVMSASGLDEGDVNPGASRWSAPTAGPTLPAIVNAIAGTSAAAAAAAIALRAMSASLPPRPPSRPLPRLHSSPGGHEEFVRLGRGDCIATGRWPEGATRKAAD